MPYGTVKWFKDEKGLGIIGQDDGGEDLFVHSNDIDASGWRTLREGQRVSYEVISGQKGKQAAGVRDVGPRRKSFLDKLETGGFAVKTSLTIDGLWLDKMPASPGSDDARKTHNKLPEAVHPMTPNSPYVGVNREPETHETYKGNVLQQLEDSMKASADSLRKCLELEEKIRRPTLEMAPEAKRHALRDYSEQQQEPFEQKGRSQGDFPGMSHAETMVPSEINIKSAPVSKEKISEQPQSIVFDENSLTPLEQVHLRPGLKGYAFTPSKESSNTVMPGDFESTTYSKSHLPESSPSQPAEANTSHHFGTVNPADEAGYASTQTDSASQLSDDLLSKRIEEAIAAEARAEAANISKMLPHTADSDYEPSEFLGGEGSICSQEESISSKSSIDVLLGPTEEFVTLLIDQTKLPTLYPTFYQAFEFPDFKSQLHHLLKVFSRDLSKEASIPVEKESVRFISQQRRRISHAIGQEVFGLKQQSLFQSNTKQQQPDAKEKIERFFSKIANDEEPISAQEDQNSDNDSSDDEAELSVFPNLDQVRKFLIESKALEKLRINVKNLAEQQNSASIRPDAKSHGELKDREGPKPNELMEGKEIEGIIVPQPGLEKEQSSSNHLRYVEDVAENIELQVWAGSRLISSSGLKETAYRVLARHFRPTVKAGYKRLEWKCDCGTTLYGDFFAHNSIEIDKLGEELGAYGYEGQSKHGNGVKTVPTGQGQSNQPSRGPIAPQRSTGNQTTSTQPTTPAAALPASHPTNCGLGTTIPPPRSPPPPVIKKYTALCVNTGEFNKTLGEIDISSITTDRQMFHRFKEAYHELRGFRARAVRWFLIKPVDIKFIQFSVEDSHRVDIIPEPPDCTICATDAEVRSRQYEPQLHASARTHPPISADAFLHYWQCHSKERTLQRTKWLNRFPRKLDKKLEDLRRVTPIDDDVLGWGIHVIEGLNTALVTFLTFLMLLISGVISLWFSIWNSDVSGGFAIGAYMVALWVAFITALYFQWKRE